MTCLVIIEQMPVHQPGEVPPLLSAAVCLDPGPPCLVLRLLDGVELAELRRSQRAHVPSHYTVQHLLVLLSIEVGGQRATKLWNISDQYSFQSYFCLT